MWSADEWGKENGTLTTLHVGEEGQLVKGKTVSLGEYTVQRARSRTISLIALFAREQTDCGLATPRSSPRQTRLRF